MGLGNHVRAGDHPMSSKRQIRRRGADGRLLAGRGQVGGGCVVDRPLRRSDEALLILPGVDKPASTATPRRPIGRWDLTIAPK
jgi:hypothetical protein